MDFNFGIGFTEAHYTAQRIPQYKGNPFIEALPNLGDEDDILKDLARLPDFHEEQRGWTDAERMQLILQLSNFMVPLQGNLQLGYAVDAIMRQGYVGRTPRSKQSVGILNKLNNKGICQLASTGELTPQLSSALIGMPGIGKTTALKRLLSRIPQVIYHLTIGFYQVTYLYIEMPYDGASVTGLAHSIFRKLDQLLPEANYYEQYCNSNKGAATLMNHAARLLLMHGVGLLVVDEIQNLENSPKNKKALMTLLVSASNELGTPILFVGTNKARKLLSLDFRQARRSVGLGIPSWDRLTKGTAEKPGEWEFFINVLLRFQWVREPLKVSPYITDLLFHYSQGIIDIAIKLFAACQVRAIMDGSERITGQLIDSVAHRELQMVAPMIDALRRNDIQALELYDDIAPLELDELLSQVQDSYSGPRVTGASTKPGSAEFTTMATKALAAVGYQPETALSLVESVSADGATDALDAVQKAIAKSKGGPKARRPAAAPPEPKDLPPGDYRRAMTGTEGTVFERLGALGMLPDLDALFA